MICTYCQTPMPEMATGCPKCGASVSTQGEENVRTRASLASRLPLLASGIYLVAVFVFFSFMHVRKGGAWAHALGYEAGICLLPSILVLLFYRKKRGVSPGRILFVLTSWLLLANLISWRGNRNHISESDIPVIAKEAAGLAPI